MSIATVFAHVSCNDIKASTAWYEKLFGKAPDRLPKSELAEFQFSDSAEVQICEEKENAGHTNLTLGVLPLEPERKRLVNAGLDPSPIEEADGYFVMRIRDPDRNPIVFASAKKS